MTMLYAWVHPLSFDKNIDHTWVTTYPNPPVYADIQDVKNAGEDYWYCWGIYHPEGKSTQYAKGAIGNASGNLALSICLVTPNDPKGRGTIFIYAIDGVCHQVANQVLYSTSGPLTVKLAKGYWLSSHLYGTYGRNKAAWAAQIASCSQRADIMTDSPPPDDFAEHFMDVSGETAESKLYRDIMNIRARFDSELEALHKSHANEIDADVIANSVNDLMAVQLARAAEILGPVLYEKVYGFQVGEPIRLVDPQFIEIQNQRPEPESQA